MNIKPSELPIGTSIKDKVWGYWTKESDNVWRLDTPHCVDCSEIAFDRQPSDAEKELLSEVLYYHMHSDQFFAEFEIVSLPFAVVERMAKEIVAYEETEWHTNPDGTPFTIEAVIRDVIEEVRTTDVKD